jgi:type IV fimbrial biogenesis protein FimT
MFERIRTRGFTLIELMVTVSVLAIALALAAPAFMQLIATNRLSGQTNEFIATLHLARSEAVRRAQPVTLRANSDPDDYAKGWQVFTDADANGSEASPSTSTDGTVLRLGGPLAGGTTINRATRSGSSGTFSYTTDSTSADRRYVTFTSRGTMNSNGPAFFRICDARTPGIGGRVVQINIVGKISLDTSAASCS